jgi:glyoxylase-like metal-dependent hydrolase (beta-lactamase superfamily II)
MDRVARHLGLAGRVRISNVWLLESGGERFLVDTGHPVERLALLLDLRRAGIQRRGDLSAILLTHRHSDHAGNAAWLRNRFSCPVICHKEDAPILRGTVPPPPLLRRDSLLHQRILCWIEDRFPARCEVDGVYSEGPWRHELEVMPVPGHTEGSVVLYHGPTKTLFSGDAILAGPPPLRSIEHLRLAVPGFSLDAARCHASARGLLERLPPVQTLCSGHGPAVKSAAHEKIARLLSRG